METITSPPVCPVQRYSTTVVMSIAAAAAALIAMLGDKDAFSTLTAAAALVGLVPWALEAGGRRLPTVVFLLMTAAPAAVIVLVDRNPGGMFPMMLMVVSVTRRSDSPAVTAAAVAAGLGSALGLAILEQTTHETGAVYFAGGVGVAWLAGSLIRRQELLLAELQAATDRQAEHAAAAERTRIAREVHDVVAHSLTVTVLHVAGARRALATDPQRAAEALERAETVGRESLDSIRQIVGLLRDDRAGRAGDETRSAPLPGLDGIDGLVAEFGRAGMSVDARLDLDAVSVDPAVGLAAYRVVQEALSNAHQHAPGAAVQVEATAEPTSGTLRIVVRNAVVHAGVCAPDRSGRTGLGLLGMTERVRATGGDVTASVVDGDWTVEATMPLRRVHAAT